MSRPTFLDNKPKNEKDCKLCGTPFVPTCGFNLYCSSDCSEIAQKKQKKEQQKRWLSSEKGQEYIRDYRKKNQHKPKYLYWHYNNGAKKRSLPFEITFEEFMEYWQEPCVYCGDDIEYIGLDRVEPELGYTGDNIVPCCIICNRMKSNYDSDFFINHIEKIYERSEHGQA